MEQLAKALQDYKESHELSLRALAEELGVQHGTAETWLKGFRKPGYKHLPRIVEVIEVDEVTIYRWLTEDPDDGKHQYRRFPGLPAYRPLTVAA